MPCLIHLINPSHKLHDLHLTISAIHTHTEIINKRVEGIQPNLEREMKAQFASLEHVLLRHFEDEDQALDTIRNTVTRTPIRLQRTSAFLSPNSPVPSEYVPQGTNMTKTPPRKQCRRLQWRLSVFEFPIGTLVVERGIRDDDSSICPGASQTRPFSFRFQPCSWVSDGIFSVDHFFSTMGQNLPAWQRIQQRVPSLLPQALSCSPQETDLFELGRLLATCSKYALYLMHRNFHVSTR